MSTLPGPPSPRTSFHIVLAMLAMTAIPAALTLHTARVAPAVDFHANPNPTPYGYTISLLLFLIPIAVIALWFLPRERVRVSRQAFVLTIALLFPVGALMDFFFANTFFTFLNPAATLGIRAPALHGGVPVEEYLFYLTGFLADLLLYIWFDAYWLAAYSTPNDSAHRIHFDRLFCLHTPSLLWGLSLIAAAIAWRRLFVPEPGFPGYFLFLVLTAVIPSAALLPTALPVINWRALSLTLFFILLTSLLWEATLGVPYRWWGFQPNRMIGLTITAWSDLPIEEICVWITVTYATVIVYETLRRWKASGRTARDAFMGSSTPAPKKV
ncbi:MAG: hypothetical protein JWM43_139 [Acidobacteriaceae bacterium]|nr:hypothetical protein [Acidobacteriaceae bacterium]